MLAYEFSVTDRVAGLHAGIAMDETQPSKGKRSVTLYLFN
jgi:hypothetical protein